MISLLLLTILGLSLSEKPEWDFSPRHWTARISISEDHWGYCEWDLAFHETDIRDEVKMGIEFNIGVG